MGFVGAADNARRAVVGGDIGALSFQVYLAVGVISGAAIAIRGPLRLPDAARASRALIGGVLMGVGGTVAHGCNIGNGLTGVPLLSLGSLLAITSMALGAAMMRWRLLLSPRPRLRGHERPEPTW
ncbi:MAG: YeeE/YedE family protein [Thermoleophilaceae bacterium]|nr:YeeE/YedE family protein [Thermoleophilaceae bacterium]